MTTETQVEPVEGLENDIATLDVFLAAYADEPDGDVIASVVAPDDDLLTLGALRRILAALKSATPAIAEVEGKLKSDDLTPGTLAHRLSHYAEIQEMVGLFEPILRFHETGGHEGDGSDAALAKARAFLAWKDAE